jgi:hypothetical protein
LKEVEKPSVKKKRERERERERDKTPNIAVMQGTCRKNTYTLILYKT